MANYRDDWEKPRGKGEHLTDAEIAMIKAAYIDKRPIRDVARELRCSSRNVTKYYGFFRAEGVRQESGKRHVTGPRFYTSTFEPT